MTSRSTGTQPERIVLPGQPDSTSNGRSSPHAVLTTPQLRAHADELGFSPQDQVRWLAPGQLIRTAIQVLLASAFSAFTDKRELQRGFGLDDLELAADPDGGCWIDFAADTGDGFDSTFTVASLLAAAQLEVAWPDGGQVRALPRGRLLVLGGDEVYPTASSERYEDRLKGPFRTALQDADVGADPPKLIALPGNHDWYDGLTAFLRVFGQGRRIGGWQTVQSRSYFVVKLPNGWWLAGLDSQLGSEIDDPQLDFFHTQLSQRLQPGDGVILCVATPTWVHTEYDARAFDSFHYFERTLVTHVTDRRTGASRPTDAQVRLWITGDHHHYHRYSEDLPAQPGTQASPRQLVVSGLAGAYLAATHHLPEAVTLPPAGSTEREHGDPVRYRLAERWPSERDSRRMVSGLLSPSRRGLPLRNPGFWRLATGVHAVIFLLLVLLLGVVRQQGPVDAVRAVPISGIWRLGLQLGLWWVVAVVVSSVISSLNSKRIRGPALALSGLGLQLALAIAALAATVWVVRVTSLPDWLPGGRALPNSVLLTVMAGVVGTVAGLVGSYAVALTLALSRARLVGDWQFSAQAIEDRKGFIRLRIDPDGRLLVHPVVVDQVNRRWRIGGDTPNHRPPRRVSAADGLPAAHLIEAPIVILRGPAGPG